MNKKVCILVVSCMFLGCDSYYFLKADDCYVQKKNNEYGTIYTSLQHITLGPEFYLIIDDIQGVLKIDRDNIYLFMNGERQMLDWREVEDRNRILEEPFLRVYTKQGENRDQLISAEEFIKLKFYIDYTLPMRGDDKPHDSFSVNIQLKDMEHCLTGSECESQKYEYSFTYNTRDDESAVRRKDSGTAGWWRNPNVEVCVAE